ncbi:MAG: LPS export ABC transporter periplasmic protein LptC [Firmicutes bacterium]|nr:LPS export ABC transporter periplasmic protein LptC [Bacillota bacterium]
MKLIRFFLLIAAAIIISASAPVFAQDSEVRLNADRLVYDQAKKVITLEGNVRFNYKNTILSGDRANFNTTTKKGKVEGNVRIYQPGTTLVGEVMTVDYAGTTAKLTGSVQIVTIRDMSAAQGSDKEKLESGLTTMNCDNLTYNWITREGEANGKVKVEQKNRRAYSDKARYSQPSDLITLEGNVRFEQGSNDWVTCEKAYIDMKKETFMATGGVTGNFLVQGQEKKEEKKNIPEKPGDKVLIPDLPFEEKKLPE